MSDEGSSPIVVPGPSGLKLALVDVDDVKHHEETVPELLLSLMREIERDGVLKHPIIVDEASLVVLDGTHRVEALRALNCRWAAACLVDYKDPSIRLGCWYRTLRGLSSLRALVDRLSHEFGFVLKERQSLRPDEVGVPPIALALTDGREFISLIAEFDDKREAWELVELLETALRKIGIEVEFEDEEDAMRKLSAGEVDAVLMTPKVLKQDVLSIALSGQVFPHKTTRHIIPNRPLFLNVPLGLLRAGGPRQALEEAFRELVASKRARCLPPGSVVDGRRYEEPIIILE